MPNRRNIMLDTPVNPGIMPGLLLIADDITVDDGAVVTITFPAKTIWCVMVQTTGSSVTKARSVSSEVGTVTLTANGDGTITYIIFASITETVADLDIAAAGTYAMTPVT